MLRRGAVVARGTVNPQVVGSNPTAGALVSMLAFMFALSFDRAPHRMIVANPSRGTSENKA